MDHTGSPNTRSSLGSRCKGVTDKGGEGKRRKIGGKRWEKKEDMDKSAYLANAT